MSASTRGRALTTFAVLFALLALSNFLKPFRLEGADTGFVFFGTRLSGAANAILGPAFGAYLLAYAAGIWRMKRYAVPMANGYAAYVIINIALFAMKNPTPAGAAYIAFVAVYSIAAIGGSVAAAVLLGRRRADLT